MSDSKAKPPTQQEMDSDKPVVGNTDETKWGEIPADNFGYASDEERRAKRGLENWEMVENVADSQAPVPRWFFAIIVAVLLVAVGLSFPFWGDRPGYEREWINWGFGVALLYLAVFGTFVYFMVQFSAKVDSDIDLKKPSKEKSSNENLAKETDDQSVSK